MMSPSFISFFTCARELAFPISDCSAGLSQILRCPTPLTEAARRFWERRLTGFEGYEGENKDNKSIPIVRGGSGKESVKEEAKKLVY